MKKILVATEKPFAEIAVDGIRKIISEAGYTFALLEKYTEKSSLLKAVSDADALIIRSDKIDKEVLDAASKLKIVVRAGAGYDNIDIATAAAKGIVAMNTPGQNSNAVAELALGMMVYYARGFYNGKAGTELRGKKLGIHAYGNVGRYVANIAKGFGMKIYAFDPFVAKAEIEKDGINVVDSVEELYSTCRYISLHIPANDKTKESIGFDLLSEMPTGAVLVNTARKEVIDEAGLLKVLEERDDFGYLSDIAPLCAEEITKKFPERCFFTPKKMGAQTKEANVNAGIAAILQILSFFGKGDTTYKVN